MNPASLQFVLTWAMIIVVNTIGGYLIADRFKGRPTDGAIVGFLLGPVGWLLLAVFEDHRRQCLACRSVVDRQATVCRWCGKELADNRTS